jgi:hypothetical protein
MQENMQLVFANLPSELQDHLSMLGVSPSMFLPPWLITVFAADFPLSFSGRLLDIMLAEGWRRILINTAASLLTVAMESLLAADSMEAALNVLKVRYGSFNLGVQVLPPVGDVKQDPNCGYMCTCILHQSTLGEV